VGQDGRQVDVLIINDPAVMRGIDFPLDGMPEEAFSRKIRISP
jgi:hypothetical protein